MLIFGYCLSVVAFVIFLSNTNMKWVLGRGKYVNIPLDGHCQYSNLSSMYDCVFYPAQQKFKLLVE